ncbi:phage tail family protein [Streptomyces sp. NPDC058369]|uniref:phage tail family protein n=1 Tax=Streptomyces sp. NPDC058369 TaxID=3346462 RepID=UPI00365B42E3
MPIPVQVQAPVVVAADVPQPPQKVRWGRTYVSITGRNGQGEEIALTNFSNSLWPGIVMMPGATGLDAPPFELHADDSPNLDGGMFRDARAVAREIMIPVFLFGIDRQTIKSLKSKLISSLNPKKGFCVLKFVEGDANPRYLRCYYKGGMEGSETTDEAGFTWKKYAIQFTAYDPYFYGDDVKVAEWAFGTGEAFLHTTSFFPLHINAGLVVGSEIDLSNPGDVEAWPIWELTGPIRGFHFTSPDGLSFGITAPVDGSNVIPTGRTLTVDTRPGYKTLMDDLGTNYWPLLDPSPELWQVPEGDTVATVDILPGSDNASVRLSFQPKYEEY